MSTEDLYANFWAVPCGCDGHGDHAACTKACRQWGCVHPKGAVVVTAFEGGCDGNQDVRKQINALRRTTPPGTELPQNAVAWNDALDAVLEIVGQTPYPNKPVATRPAVTADVHALFETLRRADREFGDLTAESVRLPPPGGSKKQERRLAKRRHDAAAAVSAARTAIVRAIRAEGSTQPRAENLVQGRLDALREALEGGAWTAETSASPDAWTPERPSVGQCAVTALVVQDKLGGVLLRTVNAGTSHYFNLLPGDVVVDLTRDQFDVWEPTAPIETRTREYVLSFPETAARYAVLVEGLSGRL